MAMLSTAEAFLSGSLVVQAPGLLLPPPPPPPPPAADGAEFSEAPKKNSVQNNWGRRWQRKFGPICSERGGGGGGVMPSREKKPCAVQLRPPSLSHAPARARNVGQPFHVRAPERRCPRSESQTGAGNGVWRSEALGGGGGGANGGPDPPRTGEPEG